MYTKYQDLHNFGAPDPNRKNKQTEKTKFGKQTLPPDHRPYIMPFMAKICFRRKNRKTRKVQPHTLFWGTTAGDRFWYYDIRKEARTSEVEALGKAKAVLSGADFALVQTKNGHLRASRRA